MRSTHFTCIGFLAFCLILQTLRLSFGCRSINQADAHRLKCNREKPCQNCIVRGESNAASCVYVEKVDGKHSSKSNPRSDAEDMRKRINRLEKSILSMMSNDGTQLKQPKHVIDGLQMDEDDTSDEIGGQELTLDSRSTNWEVILNDVSDCTTTFQ